MTDTVTVLKQILDSSAQLSTTGLAVIGGTVAVVVGTSYRRPDAMRWRLPILLFAPGWICVGWSLYLANVIAGRYLASTMVNTSDLAKIAERVNDDYGNQRFWLLASLIFFGAWLMISLYLWVFVDTNKKEGT
jgi:uncharacterized membrane protein